MINLKKIQSFSWLYFLDGVKRHTLLGLIVFALLAELSTLFFYNFVSRDIGRVANDFILSIGWLTGFIFILFYGIQTIALDIEKKTIYLILAHPISRTEYILGNFLGVSFLLFILNTVLCFSGYLILLLVKNTLVPGYFPYFSLAYFLLSWVGIFLIELVLLSIAILFSSVVRGSFLIILLTLSYYFISLGIPVVLESLTISTVENDVANFQVYLLKMLSYIFYDFQRLDFKAIVTSAILPPVLTVKVGLSLLVPTILISIWLWIACLFFNRRDLL